MSKSKPTAQRKKTLSDTSKKRPSAKFSKPKKIEKPRRKSTKPKSSRNRSLNPHGLISEVPEKIQRTFKFMEVFVDIACKMQTQATPWKEVRVVSEFSGYRTAEIACECVARHLSRHGEEIALTCSSADISKNCQKVISSNSPTSCLFGDILNLLPDQVLKKVHEPVYFSQEITKGDIQKALGVQTLDFLFTKDGHSRYRMGDVPRDSQLVCHDNLLLKESPLAMDNAKAALQDVFDDKKESAVIWFSRRKNFDELYTLIMNDKAKLDPPLLPLWF